MDTLYSMWKRWRYLPNKHQFEWLNAYQNLLKYQKILKNNLILIRYEDFTNNHECLEKIHNFIELDVDLNKYKFFHSKSVQKWKKDKRYGFQLNQSVKEFAYRFGYKEQNLANETNYMWTFDLIFKGYIIGYMWRPTKNLLRKIRNSFKTHFQPNTLKNWKP